MKLFVPILLLGQLKRLQLCRQRCSHPANEFDQAIEFDSEYFQGYLARAQTYVAFGALDRALVDYDEAIRIDGSSPFVLQRRGATLYSMGLPLKAILDYTKSFSIDDQNFKTYLLRAVAYRQIGETDEALSDLTLALQLGDESPEVYTERGITYLKLGQATNAIEDFDRAIELDEESYRAYLNRGLAQLRSGLPNLALSDFTMAINNSNAIVDSGGSDANLFVNRGVAFAQLALISRSPGFSGQGVIQEALGLPEPDIGTPGSARLLQLARHEFESAIDADPRLFEAFLQRGIVHRYTGNSEDAISDLTTAIEIFPGQVRHSFNEGWHT